MVNTGIGQISGAPALSKTLSVAAPIAGEVAQDVAGQVASALLDKGKSALNGLLDGVNRVMPSLLPTATAAMATLSFRGSQGNFATTQYGISLRADVLYITGANDYEIGRPLYRRVPISDLNGFALFKDFHMEISGNMTMAEADAIVELMEKGVFLDWEGMD